ncbi:hypothetical protein TheetDRAFT_1603 [Thermoanaerobacter ethanolicus JW 200]|uniref:Uncharacterized protein n=1 Tax=Thermoanaerobacter wiegelii Rt8.B1 TaxID=697303 RepID=G2MXX0_9THEO|nr:hypothetical protein Thewi_2374 [Thermoanaerobacter wiegelii Rt8.B1]EGD51643.1 hypothetical protein TheetDRAFT_1603 [Thermoanaerobacter ethanolicus JW 200]
MNSTLNLRKLKTEKVTWSLKAVPRKEILLYIYNFNPAMMIRCLTGC